MNCTHHAGRFNLLAAFMLMAPLAAANPKLPGFDSGGTGNESDNMAEAPEKSVSLQNGNIVLTPRNTFYIEPSLTYVNSSSTQVSIEGFSVVPAIVIGLINVSQVQRDTLTAAVGLRYGITRQLELGVKIPYVYREESVRQRDALKGTPVDSIDSSEGDGLGDVEMAINYQFLPDPGEVGYWVTSLQIKSRTGKDPFEIQSRSGESDSGNGTARLVLEEQPTGSGFWSAQPGVTYIHPADPAVLYGSLSYLWNQKRDVGDEFGGTIDPGDAIGFSFGMGLSLNNRTSLTMGYSHSVVKKTRIKNEIAGLEPSFNRFQVGTFKVGFSQMLSRDASLKFSLGIGVTDAAPDLQLSVSVPYAVY